MRTSIGIGFAAALALLAAGQALAAVRADYQFENSLASSVGGAPALASIGAGSAYATETVDASARTVLTFPQGTGLGLNPTTLVTANNEYSIVLLVRFTAVNGYRKYIDFKNGTSDNGLYVRDGALEFFPATPSVATPITANSYRQVVLTRAAAGAVVGYVDGAQLISFTDTPNDGVIDAANTLRFVIDDAVTGGGEASAGAVARIRVFDTVLTPAEVAALDRAPTSVVGGGVSFTSNVPATGWGALLVLAVALVAVGAFATRRRRA